MAVTSLIEQFQENLLNAFARSGYIIVRGLAPAAERERMLQIARQHLAAAVPPLEYEADVQYPGSPASHDAPGGRTVRRLLQAYARDGLYAQWARSATLRERLEPLLGPAIELSQAHHNCVMTKDPRYSSLTSWHRDVRYWSFERDELVSVWLALGHETVENGCLLALPGSHTMQFASDQLDEAQFLRTDAGANRALLARAVPIELEPGDVLLFDARLFHAAGRNRTAATKYSVVFTYHAADNRPLAGSRSASLPDVAL